MYLICSSFNLWTILVGPTRDTCFSSTHTHTHTHIHTHSPEVAPEAAALLQRLREHLVLPDVVVGDGATRELHRLLEVVATDFRHRVVVVVLRAQKIIVPVRKCGSYWTKSYCHKQLCDVFRTEQVVVVRHRQSTQMSHSTHSHCRFVLCSRGISSCLEHCLSCSVGHSRPFCPKLSFERRDASCTSGSWGVLTEAGAPKENGCSSELSS